MERTPLVDPEALRHYIDRESRSWGRLVRARREDLRLTLDAVAGLAGTTPQTIQKIEKGQIQPRDHLRLALAFALCTEVERLFPMPDRQTVQRELAAAS